MPTILDITDFVYRTGTLTIAPGDTTATFAGTGLSAIVKDGDWLFAGGALAPIETVTDNTHVELFTPWGGPTLTTGPYVILKASLLRYHTALIGYDAMMTAAKIDGMPVIYAVPGDEPDRGIGEEGNLAFKMNAMPWQAWLKSGGVWVKQTSPAGDMHVTAPRGKWSALVTYDNSDLVSHNDRMFISRTSSNIAHEPDAVTPSDTTDWMYAGVAVAGPPGTGDKFDLAIFAGGKTRPSETLLRHVFSGTGIEFLAGLGSSAASAGVATTVAAQFSIVKNGTAIGNITFAAGSSSGTFSFAADVNFSHNDILTITAPASRDATLADISITLSGERI